MSVTPLTCFKAYDIRGQLGSELNEDIAYAIGRAFALEIKPKKIVVGGDIRLTSEVLKLALARGLQDEGVDVIDLGMTGTEEIYFATSHLEVCGGVEVTASHNPMDYNGMKLVREDSKPISGDTGLHAIKATAEKLVGEILVSQKNERLKPLQPGKSDERLKPLQPEKLKPRQRGKYVTHNLKYEFAECMLGFIDVKKLKPLKLVVNSGNGAAGPVLDAIEQQLVAAGVNIEFIKVHHKPNGNFPNGIPNPLLPECRADTANAVIKHNADMGIAWDGDFDRCFLFDENGEFIEGYYIVGLLAEAFLKQEESSKEKIDPETSSGNGEQSNDFGFPETSSGNGEQSNGFGFSETSSGNGEQSNGFGFPETSSGNGEQSNGFGSPETSSGNGEQSNDFGFPETSSGNGEQNNDSGLHEKSSGNGEQSNGFGSPETSSGNSEQSNGFGFPETSSGNGEQSNDFGFPETSSGNGEQSNGFGFPELVSGSQQVKEKIIHDPRLSWNTIDIVERAGGEAVMSKTGHAFIKERMRIENAIYGGEMSAHHYFRDFAYCDSGMIPWLLVAELLSVKGTTLSSMVKERIAAYPSSGEINSKLADPKASIAKVLAAFKNDASVFDQTDGISLEFNDSDGEWRFNLRSSNTEPVVRLNVESKGNVELMQRKTKQILEILQN